MAELFRFLQKRGLLEMAYKVKDDTDTQIILHLREQALTMKETEELFGLMGLTLNPYYKLSINPVGDDQNSITIDTRSLLGILYYLSYSVDVPESHKKAGKVAVTSTDPDDPSDWSKVSNEIMRIRSASLPPLNTRVSIRYRGAWFYISDSDIDSKTTFSLLSQLLALQSGKVKTSIPLITIPVGR